MLVSDKDQELLGSVLEFVLQHEHYDNALLHEHFYIRDDKPLVKYHRCSTALIVGDEPADIAAQYEPLIVPYFIFYFFFDSIEPQLFHSYLFSRKNQASADMTSRRRLLIF